MKSACRIATLFFLALCQLPAAAASAQAPAPPAGGIQSNGQREGGNRNGRPQTDQTPGIPPIWLWWKDGSVKREMGLTEDKAKRIDDIYMKGFVQPLTPALTEIRKELDILNQMSAERTASNQDYTLQIMRVESLRSRLNEGRLLMLYRISKELTAEQNTKLKAIGDRQFNGRGRGGPQGR